MRRRLIGACIAALLVAGATAPGLAAEEPPTACTLIGCYSSVGIDVDEGQGRDRSIPLLCTRPLCVGWT